MYHQKWELMGVDLIGFIEITKLSSLRLISAIVLKMATTGSFSTISYVQMVSKLSVNSTLNFL